MTTDRGVLSNSLLDQAAITPRTGSFTSLHESLPCYSAARLVSAAPSCASRTSPADSASRRSRSWVRALADTRVDTDPVAYQRIVGTRPASQAD
jgi:hypothetical protein